MTNRDRRSSCSGLRKAAAATLFMLGMVLAVPSPADQHAAELPALLGSLTTAPTAAAARVIEQKIWALWFEAPAPEADTLFKAGRAAGEQGNIPEALAAYDQLVQKFPDFAEAWNQRAIAKFMVGDLDGALEDVAHTLELEPRHFGALSGRGQCYLHMQRLGDALEALEAAQAINPWADSVNKQVEMLRAHQPQPKSI
ncbi:MAG: tetratricopeptide repeat protein [Gammaproteobacteria bacterium]